MAACAGASRSHDSCALPFLQATAGTAARANGRFQRCLPTSFAAIDTTSCEAMPSSCAPNNKAPRPDSPLDCHHGGHACFGFLRANDDFRRLAGFGFQKRTDCTSYSLLARLAVFPWTHFLAFMHRSSAATHGYDAVGGLADFLHRTLRLLPA